MNRILSSLSPGMRTIKTAIVIILCLLLYYLGDYLGIVVKGDAFLACVSAVICMQDSIEKSVTSGINRLRGTFIGAALGFLYSLIGLATYNVFLNTASIAVGIIILIILCNVFKLQDSIVVGCVVFLVIAMQQAVGDPLEHCIRRFIDTAVGIGLSIAVNHLILNPRKRGPSASDSGGGEETPNDESLPKE